jgi:hypothetical protein
MVYICTALNEDFTMQKSEASDIGWFSIGQIKDLRKCKTDNSKDNFMFIQV